MPNYIIGDGFVYSIKVDPTDVLQKYDLGLSGDSIVQLGQRDGGWIQGDRIIGFYRDDRITLNKASEDPGILHILNGVLSDLGATLYRIPMRGCLPGLFRLIRAHFSNST